MEAPSFCALCRLTMESLIDRVVANLCGQPSAADAGRSRERHLRQPDRPEELASRAEGAIPALEHFRFRC